jgi:hypothetical protein
MAGKSNCRFPARDKNPSVKAGFQLRDRGPESAANCPKVASEIIAQKKKAHLAAPDLPKAPPRSLNAVVDLFHTGGDGLLARAKFWRPLDSSARGIEDRPATGPARPLQHRNQPSDASWPGAYQRCDRLQNRSRLILKTQLPCFGSGTG